VRRNIAERAHAKPKDRPEMLTWSAEELASFLAFTAQDRDVALYQVAAATGMRRGESCSACDGAMSMQRRAG
jgi:hypothetical protein